MLSNKNKVTNILFSCMRRKRVSVIISGGYGAKNFFSGMYVWE